MIFETYIFESFKVRIVDSHSLDLFMRIFGVCIAVFYCRRRALYTNIYVLVYKYCAFEKYGIIKTVILRNKRERKCKTEKFLLNLVYVGLLLIKA